MKVLLVGAGVIGTVYGAQLVASGHTVTVLGHGTRTTEIMQQGLIARDIASDTTRTYPVEVISDPSSSTYDLVLVAVGADQLASLFTSLTELTGRPTILFFGNNPDGHAAIPAELGNIVLGFPGIGGSMNGATVDYIRIQQQPTTLEDSSSPVVAEFEAALRAQHFAVQRTKQMDGWLAYHAVFVASVSAALYRCATDAAILANDRASLQLMCRSIEQGFTALAAAGVKGLPRNLRVLHHRALTLFAVRYWARTLRSPMGEQCFAAHARHATTEMLGLADWVLASTISSPAPTGHLQHLLSTTATRGVETAAEAPQPVAPTPAVGSMSDTSTSPGVDLYWIPLGAGARVVRVTGRAYEAMSALIQRRARRDLYHCALVVNTAAGSFVIEMTPLPRGRGPHDRGVVSEGPVGVQWAHRFRVFRYEIRRWRSGVIPDLAYAVASPVRVANDAATAQQVLDLVPFVPTPTWGRDELHTGDMWNSNSVVAWLLTRAGLDDVAGQPPHGGGAPGWNAGVVTAQRGNAGVAHARQRHRATPIQHATDNRMSRSNREASE